VQVLNHWTLAIDQHAHRIYFLGPGLNRAWPREQASELRYRLGYLANLEGTGLRLIEVDEGAAFFIGGLRAGDLILTVNRVPAAEFALRYHPTAARKIVVRYSRAGEIMSTTIRLKPAQLPK
jgi:predicted metalloprotease with PDZ domain